MRKADAAREARAAMLSNARLKGPLCMELTTLSFLEAAAEAAALEAAVGAEALRQGSSFGRPSGFKRRKSLVTGVKGAASARCLRSCCREYV